MNVYLWSTEVWSLLWSTWMEGIYLGTNEILSGSSTITFVDWDWTILETQTLESWVTPVYWWTTPTRATDSIWEYSFSWRSPTIVPVDWDATYTAQYTLYKFYTVYGPTFSPSISWLKVTRRNYWSISCNQWTYNWTTYTYTPWANMYFKGLSTYWNDSSLTFSLSSNTYPRTWNTYVTNASSWWTISPSLPSQISLDSTISTWDYWVKINWTTYTFTPNSWTKVMMSNVWWQYSWTDCLVWDKIKTWFMVQWITS